MNLKGLFKKKEVKLEVFAPMSGQVIPITEAPDPVFSQKMMGDGFAIMPVSGHVYSPVSGKVVSVFPTNHAVGLLSDSGDEILIHVGLDTVSLNGKGFTSHVSEGARVTPETLLLIVDLESIRDEVPSLITPVVFTNLQDRQLKLLKTGNVSQGEGGIIQISG